MTLMDYIIKNRINKGEFAKKLRITPRSLYNISRRLTRPHVPVATRIERETGGEVTIKDLRS